MKKPLFAVLLFSIISTTLAQYRKDENKMKSFDWMIGSWKMSAKRGVINEKWDHLNDSTMTGESTLTKNTGETILLEKIQLAFRGMDYYYIPSVQGQNNDVPVRFRITSYSEKDFVAENPEHDFPKRIAYNAVNRDSVHAYIDGGPAMPEKRSDFYYSRVKN